MQLTMTPMSATFSLRASLFRDLLRQQNSKILKTLLSAPASFSV